MFILDIETRGNAKLENIYNEGIKAPSNYKDEDKIRAYIAEKKLESTKGMATDTDFAEIICVGIRHEGESMILTADDAMKWLDEHHANLFVTFNGKNFDVPILAKYACVHGFESVARRMARSTRRYDKTEHIDLMEILGDFRSLDTYAQIYLGAKKIPIDFKTATDEEIKEHCKEDLIITEQLFSLFKPLCV